MQQPPLYGSRLLFTSAEGSSVNKTLTNTSPLYPENGTSLAKSREQLVVVPSLRLPAMSDLHSYVYFSVTVLNLSSM